VVEVSTLDEAVATLQHSRVDGQTGVKR